MTVFSGTSYLGLDRHPAFLDLVTAGLHKYGTHYGGSRRSPLAPTIFSEVETAIAKWTGAPAALLVSSGTAAGQLVVRLLSTQAKRRHASPLVHPALTWPGNIQHQDWNNWKAASNNANNALLTDSVDALTVQWPAGIRALKKGDATLVVDDSHLIGHYGLSSAGSWRQLRQQWSGQLIVTASLGKALCIPAGVILGNKNTISELQNMIHYGGASPPNPAFLYAWLHGDDILSAQRQRLKMIIGQAQEWVKGNAAFRFLPDFPVLRFDQHEWVDELAKRHIVCSSFHYPGPTDARYSRLVLTAGHTDEELQKLKITLEVLVQ